eukprot:TRINITY_DN21956_c0_g1_i1.p1 TRINITY_DN21956_c0_g1~~TRINITY_DN21956_c0_g1_i1.p1  ORF type:complete len:872 (+),score=160.52 TRINITY_DN21956_c0_g1_i1:315-2618(+)
MVVFANIVFNTTSHPRLNEQFSTGVNLNFMAATITLGHSAVFSSMAALVAPQDVPSLLLGQLGGVIAEVVEDDKKVGHTLIAAGWICTLTIGCFGFLLGKLEAGKTLQKMPAPVTGGFIAAMGCTGIRSALSTLTGAPFYIMWPTDITPFYDWKTWTHLALALYAFFSIRYLPGKVKPLFKNKSVQAIATPLCLLSPIFMMYVVLFCRGQMQEDLAWMHEVGWMYPAVEAKPFYTMWQETYCPSLIDWSVFMNLKVVTPMIICSALTCLSAVLSIVGTVPVVPCDTSKPGGVGGDVDLDRELVLLGSGQLFVGCLTGFPGYQQTALSRNMVLLGGSHRLAEFVASGFVFMVLVSGVQVAAYIPKYFLQAVFFNLGFDFCKTYLYDNWGIMHWDSYFSMLAIVFVALWKDLSYAVALGILMQSYLMVSIASGISPVFQAGTFDGGFISSRIRSWREASRMRWSFFSNSCYNRLEVFRLQGPIFFGNAVSLEHDIEQWMHAARSGKPKCTHIVFDMRRVTQVDDTGALSLARICNKAYEHGFHRVAMVAGDDEDGKRVREEFKRYLKKENKEWTVDMECSLEDTLERFETQLLDEQDPESDSMFLAQRFQDVQTWEQIKQRASSAERQLKDGEVLYNPGDIVDGFYLLVSGVLAMETFKAGAKHRPTQDNSEPLSNGRDNSKDFRTAATAAMFSAPCPVGQSPYFLGAGRHGFRMVARGPATVLALTKADLAAWREKDPELYITFLQEFCCYWYSAEANQLRWRCALNN